MDRRQDVTMETRVAVLETRIDDHAYRLEQNQETTVKLMDRIDQHILLSSQRDAQLQQNLADVTLAVSNLAIHVEETNKTLKTLAELATSSSNNWTKFDSAVKTTFKIGSVACMCIGAIWAVYTFYVDHIPTKVSTPSSISQAK